MPNKIQIAIIINIAVLVALVIGGLLPSNESDTKDKSEATKENPIVNIYSYRQPELINPLLAQFTQDTGIKTQIIFASKGLLERLRIEGENAPADIILTTDIGILQSSEDVAQAVLSPTLAHNIPAHLRDSKHLWFGLSLRARVAFVAKDRVDAQTLTYAQLAHPEWRGRICMRSGQHPYNIALFAAMLVHLGEDEFRTWLRGLKTNLAQSPSGNDRAQVRNVYGGVCDIAIGNTYYMGKMLTNDKQPEQKKWAQAVRLIFPAMPVADKGNGGAHVNITGVAMAKYAPHPKAALALMEYLTSRPAQMLYAESNFEYPIVAGIAPSALVQEWGTMTPDTLPMERIATARKAASRIVDEVGFNE